MEPGSRVSIEQAMKETGTTSPSQALKAFKARGARKGYVAHIGAKQRAKAIKRLQQKQTIGQ
jgi:hypothetical protein